MSLYRISHPIFKLCQGSFCPSPNSCCLLTSLSSRILLGQPMPRSGGSQPTLEPFRQVLLRGWGALEMPPLLPSMCTRNTLGCCKSSAFPFPATSNPRPAAGAGGGLGNFMIDNHIGSYSCQEKVNCTSCLGAPADHRGGWEGVFCLCSAFPNPTGCRMRGWTMCWSIRCCRGRGKHGKELCCDPAVWRN